MHPALPPSAKRKRPAADDDTRQGSYSASSPSSRLPPLSTTAPSTVPSTHKKARHTLRPDLLSPLSDELLVRILSLLSLPDLLSTSPVSRRFHALSADSQLWRRLYYARFVLPRALRIPGFRDGSAREGKLHYASRRNLLWADGRRGGWVDAPGPAGSGSSDGGRGDWKRQYRLRHNWALGKCAVEELHIRPEVPRNGTDTVASASDAPEAQQRWSSGGKTLVKVVDGVALTADLSTGLRAWDLRTKKLLAQTSLSSGPASSGAAPSCIAIDDQKMQHDKTLDVAIGFVDGSFGVWRVGLERHNILRRYRHEKSSNGALVGVAFSHPYLLTATKSVLVSLYTFNIPVTSKPERGHAGPRQGGPGDSDSEIDRESATESHTEDELNRRDPRSRRSGNKDDRHGRPNTKPTTREGVLLPAPYLLTSLKSHTSRDPLALSIRKSAGGTTVASIAYTFSTIQGWSLGIQDLHIRPPLPVNHHADVSASKEGRSAAASPEVVTTRLAYTLPVQAAPRWRRRSRTSGLAARRAARDDDEDDAGWSNLRTGMGAYESITSRGTNLTNPNNNNTNNSSHQEPPGEEEDDDEGPISICYTHPYLLATLPDNTLILHLCTSTSTSLSISPGIRLWGHTSGISDAEITARGKAVSVSQRGDEVRVWELEGRGNYSSIGGVRWLGGRDAAGRGGGGVATGAGFVHPPAGSSVARRILDSSDGSIAVRPVVRIGEDGVDSEKDSESMALAGQEQWDDKRNWVGFDDEMVIVLKEAKDGRESLLVYDFT